MKHSWTFRVVVFAVCAALSAGTARPQTNAALAPPAALVWPVQEALLFDGGGLLAHEGTVKLTGTSGTFALTGLTRALDPRTVRVALPDGWSLGTFSFTTQWVESEKKAAETEFNGLREKRNAVFSTIRMREALYDTYGEELEMLTANRAFGGNEAILVEDMKEMADFWRTRVKELHYLRLELDLELGELREDMAEWDKKMAEVAARIATPPGSLVFTVDGPEGGSGKVRIEYVTSAASWQPEYDITVNAQGQVEFVRCARVTQTTGTAWDRIGLEVTVGGAVDALTVPELEPWILRAAASGSFDREVRQAYRMPSAAAWGGEADLEDKVSVSAARSFNGFIAQGPVERYAFRPSGRVSIPGDGTAERVELERFTLPAKVEFVAVPSEVERVYQVAVSSEFAQARLVAGEAQILAGGAFLGRLSLEVPAAGDTLEIPLGPSSDLRIRRERDAERSRTTATPLKKRTASYWKLTLENTRKTAVTVRVLERIPVSPLEEITVDPATLTGGTYDPTTGFVTWLIDLKPGEVRTWDFGYAVEYPKKLRLLGM
jgi:uncharacterized protein (TIGR02231 family)